MTVSILTYHGIGADAPRHRMGDGAFYTVTRTAFAMQLQRVQEAGAACIGLEEVLQWHAGQRAVPPRAVVLTFDDGDVTHATEAWPLMARYGMTGTMFIVPAFVGQRGYVTWSQVRELRAAGAAIGSHGLSHAHLTTLGASDIRRELCDSKARIEDALQAPVTVFSVPGGFYDRRVEHLVRESGYAAACTSRVGWVGQRDDPYRWPRFTVRRGWTADDVARVLNGDRALAGRLRAQRAAAAVARALVGVRRYERLKASWAAAREHPERPAGTSTGPSAD